MASVGSAVALREITLQYGRFVAVQGIDFEVPSGQFVALVGPTGCGKSSVLNMVAGLLHPTRGRVLCGGAPLFGLNRDAAYMFQADALLPWKTALDNVMLGPRMRGVPRAQATEDARAWMVKVGLAGFESRYPHQLSGGQRRRVAMAQALINRLPVLLMDEPFSALDAQTRALMEQELLGLWEHLEATVLFVTHDLEEAVALSDRILLFTAGPGATIKGDYPVKLPRPRSVVEARFMPGFNEVYERVWNDLRDEVMAGYARQRSSER
jgi:NitT/TauT family transport system ATP-binding protein